MPFHLRLFRSSVKAFFFLICSSDLVNVSYQDWIGLGLGFYKKLLLKRKSINITITNDMIDMIDYSKRLVHITLAYSTIKQLKQLKLDYDYNTIDEVVQHLIMANKKSREEKI